MKFQGQGLFLLDFGHTGTYKFDRSKIILIFGNIQVQTTHLNLMYRIRLITCFGLTRVSRAEHDLLTHSGAPEIIRSILWYSCCPVLSFLYCVLCSTVVDLFVFLFFQPWCLSVYFRLPSLSDPSSSFASLFFSMLCAYWNRQ